MFRGFLAVVVLVFVLAGSASADLVAHYEFEEGSGTAISDSTTNVHNGTFGSPAPAWTTGKLGNYALDMSSNDSAYANFGTWNPSGTGGDFTVGKLEIL